MSLEISSRAAKEKDTEYVALLSQSIRAPERVRNKKKAQRFSVISYVGNIYAPLLSGIKIVHRNKILGKHYAHAMVRLLNYYFPPLE